MLGNAQQPTYMYLHTTYILTRLTRLIAKPARVTGTTFPMLKLGGDILTYVCKYVHMIHLKHIDFKNFFAFNFLYYKIILFIWFLE